MCVLFKNSTQNFSKKFDFFALFSYGLHNMSAGIAVKPTLEHCLLLEDYYDLLVACVPNPQQALADKHELPLKEVRDMLVRPANANYLANKVSGYMRLAEVDRIRALEELKNIAFSNFTDIAEFDGCNLKFKDWSTLPDSVKASIAEASTKTDKNGNVTFSVKQHSKMDAMRTLTNILKMQDNTVVHTGEVEHRVRLFDNVFSPPVPPIEAEFTEGAPDGLISQTA